MTRKETHEEIRIANGKQDKRKEKESSNNNHKLYSHKKLIEAFRPGCLGASNTLINVNEGGPRVY